MKSKKKNSCLPDDFAVFILTHGRPDRVYTYNTLKKSGYTGKVYIVIDNEDVTADQYYERYGEKVMMFDKKAVASTFDEADNFNDRRSIVYARNACFDIADKVGVTYFMQLDDDYTTFAFRFDNELYYRWKQISNLDAVLLAMLRFYKRTDALAVAMSQGGDFIGGSMSKFARSVLLSRKCMNTILCSTERPFQFVGRINEDVNTYCWLGSRGGLFLTTNFVCIQQKQTQSNSGGMTDIYLDNGTYVKSFYTIIFHPSSVCIGLMGNKYMRLHHHVNWKNTVPRILDERYKKRA